MSSSTVRVAVVGAGVIGRSVAWRARAAGHEVVAVDPRPASGASWVAGGMLAPLTEAWPGEAGLLDLGLAALGAWPEFAAELAVASGRDPGLRTDGTVVVAVDAADKADLDRVAALLAASGRRVESVGSRELRRLEPMLAPGLRGGLWVPDELSVDNRALLAALAAAAGPELTTEVRAVGQGRVELADGSTVDCDVVVVAAGAWSGQVYPRARHWVRPVKGEILRLRARAGALAPPTRTVRAGVEGRPVYLVPRPDDGLVLGATQYDVGFDTEVTVAGVRDLLRDAERVLPGIAEYALVEANAGLRPGTHDNLPLVGWAEPGVLVATGHHRNGMLLAPVTAAAVVDLIEGRPVPERLAVADPARFAATSGRERV